MRDLYLDRNGQTSGPFTPERVLEMIRQAELAETDEVWMEGTPRSVSVAELLNGRRPAAAGSDIFEPLASDRRHSRGASRARADGNADAVVELLNALPGIGRAAAPAGGGLFAVFILVLYVWGTWHQNVMGERHRHLDELRTKIVRHVDQHPEIQQFSLDDLHRAGIVTDADLDLIETMELSYHPIGAASPADALVFTREADERKYLYYKRLRDDQIAWWFSPDEGLKLVSAPKSPAAGLRLLTLVDASTGQVLDRYETKAVSTQARWRSDSTAVAVTETRPGGIDHLTVWYISPAGPQRLVLPGEIDPENCLRPEDRQHGHRWSLIQINPERWLRDGRLLVESYGSAAFLDHEAAGAGSVMVRTRFVLTIAPDGTVSISERETKGYHKSEPRKQRNPCGDLWPC